MFEKNENGILQRARERILQAGGVYDGTDQKLFYQAALTADFSPATLAVDAKIRKYLDGSYGVGTPLRRAPYRWERGGGDAELDSVLFPAVDAAIAAREDLEHTIAVMTQELREMRGAGGPITDERIDRARERTVVRKLERLFVQRARLGEAESEARGALTDRQLALQRQAFDQVAAREREAQERALTPAQRKQRAAREREQQALARG